MMKVMFYFHLSHSIYRLTQNRQVNLIYTDQFWIVNQNAIKRLDNKVLMYQIQTYRCCLILTARSQVEENGSVTVPHTAFRVDAILWAVLSRK